MEQLILCMIEFQKRIGPIQMTQEKKNHFGIVDLINQTLRKKLFMTLVKDDKEGFIQGGLLLQVQGPCSGGERLDSTEYNMVKWGCIAKEQGGSQLLKAVQGDQTSPGG